MKLVLVETLQLSLLFLIAFASKAAAVQQVPVGTFHRRKGARSVSLEASSPPGGSAPARAKPADLPNESARADAGNGTGELSDWRYLFTDPGHVHGFLGKLTPKKEVDAEEYDQEPDSINAKPTVPPQTSSSSGEGGYEQVEAPLLMIPSMLFILIGCCMHSQCKQSQDLEQPRPRRNTWLKADWQAKADTLFAMCDRDRDGVLTYRDIQWMVSVTAHPNKNYFTRERFGDLCRPLGADPRIGLDRQNFRDCLALLDVDVEHDCESVARHLNTEDRGVVGTQAGGLMLDEDPDAA